jgi:hypothetical protein
MVGKCRDVVRNLDCIPGKMGQHSQNTDSVMLIQVPASPSTFLPKYYKKVEDGLNTNTSTIGKVTHAVLRSNCTLSLDTCCSIHHLHPQTPQTSPCSHLWLWYWLPGVLPSSPQSSSAWMINSEVTLIILFAPRKFKSWLTRFILPWNTCLCLVSPTCRDKTRVFTSSFL